MGPGNRNVEIVIHVDEVLGEQRRIELTAALTVTEGIYSARFSPMCQHLMLVRYNRINLSSQDVLYQVNNHNVHAELIGPM